MPTRDIVRHPEILGGRWHFDGTTFAVAAVRSDHKQGGGEANGSYRFMDLTDVEIASALAFEFPMIRDAVIDVQYMSLTMRCECGEDTSHATTWPHETHLECQCGRTWIIEVTFRPLMQRITAQSS